MGICGGYQMLGTMVADPDGVEGNPGGAMGLGLLAVNTVMGRDKTLTATHGLCLDEPVHGFEMHMGVTDGPDRARPFCRLGGKPDGAVSADGSVMGGYLHGLFAADGFRRKFLNRFVQGAASSLAYEARVERVLDDLAAHLETHLDRLLTLAEC
jgi:adenosylcobyric acid synthase